MTTEFITVELGISMVLMTSQGLSITQLQMPIKSRNVPPKKVNHAKTNSHTKSRLYAASRHLTKQMQVSSVTMSQEFLSTGSQRPVLCSCAVVIAALAQRSDHANIAKRPQDKDDNRVHHRGTRH